MSDTPRSDTAAIPNAALNPCGTGADFVPLCFARDLEREAATLRFQLTKCFAYLGKEIERKHLNDSARDGTQELSREVACALDATKPNH